MIASNNSRVEKKRRRQLMILRAVVEAHIEQGAPIGSKTVATRLQGVLSAASIRAVMNELAAAGLLMQPHTSSGRVPTDHGYRTYLDEVIGPPRPRAADRAAVDRLVWDDGETVYDVLRRTVELVAACTGAAGVAVAPPLERATLQQIEFVWLRPGSVLAIVVTRTGTVHERLLSVDRELSRRELEPLANYLNTLLPGLTLREVRVQIEEQQSQDRAELGALEAKALEMGRRALEDAEGSELLVEGTASVLECAEFAEPGRAAELVRALTQREVWLELLASTLHASDIKVYVGAEMAPDVLQECALVTAGYRATSGRGVVAVLGPRRIDYRRALPFVSLVAARLSGLLTPGGAPRP